MVDSDAIFLLETVSRELLLFTAVCFFISALDDLIVDAVWLTNMAVGKPRGTKPRRWSGAMAQRSVAVLVPAWQEAHILPYSIERMLRLWDAQDFTITIGCYPNDPETLAAASELARRDSRVRVVICSRDGPTSKADALNHCWRAVLAEVAQGAPEPACLLLQDAEDLVHADTLPVVEHGTRRHDFVQLPVIPLRERSARWIAGHYADEFAESHGKELVVRQSVGAAIPAAGVGCAFRIDALQRLAEQRDGDPFDMGSLTEDYELGIRLSGQVGRAAFLRYTDADGQLIATQAFFPKSLGAAVRQKSRWLAGIALAGWDRIGWSRRLADNWMRLRDRKASFAALVLMLAYLTILLWGTLLLFDRLGWYRPAPLSPVLIWLLTANFLFLSWRMAMRALFVWRLYGPGEALLSLPRLLVGNVVNIMAGRRAAWLYVKSLLGTTMKWEKTHHHPVRLDASVVPRPSAAKADHAGR